MMEYRKLISFGKSSHVVSLPKDWLVKNNLVKGDVVSLSVKDENLILRPKISKQELENSDRELVIKVDGKTLRHLEKELISGYINNYQTIVLEGEELKNNSKEIQSAIHDLIALEVMEQSSEKIVAKDFLNMQDISVSNLIKKMDAVARAMISDSMKTFDEDNYENIEQRDKDLNRLFFLACRAIKYGLRNPLTVSQLFNIGSDEELLNLRLAATYIEKISDTAKRAARYMHLAKFNTKQKKEFLKIFSLIESQYVEMMDAYYKKDCNKALKLTDKKDEIVDLCDKFYLKNRSTDWTAFLITEMKHMIIRVYSIGRAIYQ